jgi:hypothetical protein
MAMLTFEEAIPTSIPLRIGYLRSTTSTEYAYRRESLWKVLLLVTSKWESNLKKKMFHSVLAHSLFSNMNRMNYIALSMAHLVSMMLRAQTVYRISFSEHFKTQVKTLPVWKALLIQI